MGWAGWGRLGSTTLSRRAVTGLLAGGSVVTSRPGLDLLAVAGEMADLALATALVYQLSTGGVVVGLHVAWLFIGYFVYAYTPEMYPDQYAFIVEDRGFRVLTAATTVYAGVLFSRLMDTVPAAGAFALLPADIDGLIWAVVLGVLAGVVAFSGYVIVGRGERLVDGDSAHFAMLEWWTAEPQRKYLRQLDGLPRSTRWVAVVAAELTLGVFYLVPGAILGVALAAVNAFYPVPELFVIAGVVASYTPASAKLAAVLPSQLGADLEYRVADDATDAVRNLKGLVLSTYCLAGIGVAGIAFVAGLSLVASTLGQLWGAAVALGDAPGVSPGELPRLLAALWFVVSLATILPLFGLYGLLYWAQQLRRLPAYVPYWDATWQEGAGAVTPPETAVARPPGLYLPGAAPFALAGGLFWVSPGDATSLAVQVGFGLGWTCVVALLAWSVLRTVRGTPQSLAHEGRDVIVAILVQGGSVGLLGVTTGDGVRFRGIALAALAGIVLVGFGYWPEVDRYSERHDDARTFLTFVYVVALLAVLLTIVETIRTVPPGAVVVLAALLGVWAVLRYIWTYKAPDEP